MNPSYRTAGFVTGGTLLVIMILIGSLGQTAICVRGAVTMDSYDNIDSVISRPTMWTVVGSRWLRSTPFPRPVGARVEVSPALLRAEWLTGSNTIELTPISNGVCTFYLTGLPGSVDYTYNVKVKLP